MKLPPNLRGQDTDWGSQKQNIFNRAKISFVIYNYFLNLICEVEVHYDQ